MQKQRYVIIRGQVFRWEEKAPFAPSGKSIEGAIEYDRDKESLKCHECGDWHRGLAGHVASLHKEKQGAPWGTREYFCDEVDKRSAQYRRDELLHVMSGSLKWQAHKLTPSKTSR